MGMRVGWAGAEEGAPFAVAEGYNTASGGASAGGLGPEREEEVPPEEEDWDWSWFFIYSSYSCFATNNF